MDWLIFSLIARAFWAGDNIVDKLLIGRYIKNPYVLTLLGGIAPFIISIFIFLSYKLQWIGLIPTTVILLAGIIQIVAVFAFYKALAKEEVSRVIPLFQLTPVFVLILSAIFLKENLTINQYIGFILILLGGFFISLKRIEGLFKLREALWWMILSSVIYGVQVIMIKSLYVNYSYLDLTFYHGVGIFIPTFALLTFSSKSRDSFTREFSNLNIRGWFIVGLAAILIAGAYLSGLWAFRTGSATLISVLRGFQSIFVFIFSLVFSIWLPKILKEELASGVLLTKVIAISLMLVGLFFIA